MIERKLKIPNFPRANFGFFFSFGPGIFFFRRIFFSHGQILNLVEVVIYVKNEVLTLLLDLHVSQEAKDPNTKTRCVCEPLMHP